MDVHTRTHNHLHTRNTIRITTTTTSHGPYTTHTVTTPQAIEHKTTQHDLNSTPSPFPIHPHIEQTSTNPHRTPLTPPPTPNLATFHSHPQPHHLSLPPPSLTTFHSKTHLSRNSRAPDEEPMYATRPSANRRSLSNMAKTSEEGWWMVHRMVLPLAAMSFIILTSFRAL